MIVRGRWHGLAWFVAASALGAGAGHGTAGAAAPPFAWQTAAPESQGMSGPKLDALRDALAAKKTTAFLVIRNDRIVYEWYAGGQGPTKPHGTASLAKAVVGGLSLAVALTDGRIALDDRAAVYIPSWKDDPFFRAPEKTPEQPSQSVTSILSSLASPAGSGSRPPEAAPYRPEPMPSYAPPKPSESSPADPGGVTRLIQRLAQEQSAPAAPTADAVGHGDPAQQATAEELGHARRRS